VTPSVLIELDIGMVEPAILTEETGGSEIERCQVENQMAFVFVTKCSSKIE